MNQKQKNERMLSPYRVLDLTDEKGFLCGKILGDLGADVIKIEPPGGDPARNMGPYYHDIPEPEKSLFWFAYNTSKRGITLNLNTADGRDIFKKLLKTADLVIESSAPAHMEKLGLGYEDLSLINPELIMTSITPFGQNGPYKDYKAADIVISALGGTMTIAGDPDDQPLNFSVEQTYPQAGAQAAAATMMALHYREFHQGGGQHIDVSMQECMTWAAWLQVQFWELSRILLRRAGWRVTRGALKKLNIFPCKDGYISWSVYTGGQGSKTRALVDWMEEEGMAGNLKGINWGAIDFDKVTQEQLDHWESEFGKFFLRHTKRYLHEEATKRDIWLFPVNTTEDILKNPQLASRGFWVKVDHPELQGPINYPGAPLILSETPWAISGRAPLIGEHNQEIYQRELGLSVEDLVILKEAGVI